MRFVTIQIGCDWFNCSTVAAEGDGVVEEMTIALDRKAARTVGICKQHRDELMMILEPMLAKGVTDTVKTPAKRSSPASSGNGTGTSAVATTVNHDTELTCKVPGCGRDDIKGNVGLAQHLKKKHDGMTRAEHELLPEPEKT